MRPLVIVNRTASHLNSSVKRLCLFPLIVTSSILHRGWLSTFAGQVQIRFRPPWGPLDFLEEIWVNDVVSLVRKTLRLRWLRAALLQAAAPEGVLEGRGE